MYFREGIDDIGCLRRLAEPPPTSMAQESAVCMTSEIVEKPGPGPRQASNPRLFGNSGTECGNPGAKTELCSTCSADRHWRRLELPIFRHFVFSIPASMPGDATQLGFLCHQSLRPVQDKVKTVPSTTVSGLTPPAKPAGSHTECSVARPVSAHHACAPAGGRPHRD